MKRLIPILGLFMVFLFTAFALAVEIRGVVVDKKTGEPLAGVNIYVKGEPIGTASDMDGVFFLDIPEDKAYTVVFEYLGYKPYELEVTPGQTGLSNLTVQLVEDVFRSEEIVVTGLASETAKARAEVSVSRVEASDLTLRNVYQDMSQLLTAKVPGVYVKRSSGNVGSGFRFTVRSATSLNGNEQPVIYIDGVRVNDAQVTGYYVGGQGISLLADINPDDIEKIEVLKGPAGAAMYGTDGANGVILITTKRGKLMSGKTGGISVNYKVVTGTNSQLTKYSSSELESADDANAIFRKGNILEQYLNLSGGTSYVRYYASYDRKIEEGIMRNNEMDRTTGKLNVDAFPSEKVTLSASTTITLNKLSRPNNDNNIYGYLGNTLLFPVSYRFTDSASIEGLKDKWENDRVLGSLKLTYNPIKNMEIRAQIGYDRSNVREDQTFPANLRYAFVPAGRRRIYMYRSTQITWDLNGRYNYNILPQLNATTIAGAQLFELRTRTAFLEAENFATELIMDIGAGADFTGKGEGKSHQRKAGLFIQQQFNFKDTYYATLGLRREFASSIGPKAPSVYYPKASFAVRLDRFGFTPQFISLLKARAAYGETGILPSPTDPIRLLWTAENSGWGSGAVPSQIGNPEIKPETVKEFEIGFETEFFTNYALEFTYYRQNAVNSIIGFENAPSTGLIASAVPYNVGRAEGSGFEVLLQANPIKTRNIDLNLTLSMATQRNEVKDLGGAQPIYDPFDLNVIKEGLPKHEFYTWRVEGARFNPDGTYAGPKLSDERYSFGNPIPTNTGSFTIDLRLFRNFTLYVMTEWARGHKIFNLTKVFAIRFGNYIPYNELRDKLNSLTPGTPEYEQTANELAYMDWRADANFIEPADYFKVREISLSYDLRDVLKMLNADRYFKTVSLGVSFRNWFTSTKYSGADVEVNFAGARSLVRGQDFLTLMNPKTFNFFLRFSL